MLFRQGNASRRQDTVERYWPTCRRDEVGAKEVNHELYIYRCSAPKNYG